VILRAILFSSSLVWAVRRSVGFKLCITVLPFLVVYAPSRSNKRVVSKFELVRFLVKVMNEVVRQCDMKNPSDVQQLMYLTVKTSVGVKVGSGAGP
jgi:hypothetical protein